MSPQAVEAIGVIIGMLTLGSFTLIGLRMYLGYKTRRLELTGGALPAHLEEAIDELRQEVQALRGDVGELHERVDFAERLLTRGQET